MKKPKKEIIVVGTILLVILVVNLVIINYFSNTIDTNYYEIPEDENHPFFGPYIVIVAFEKEIEPNEFGNNMLLGIENSTGDQIMFTELSFWKWNETNNKALYVANFTYAKNAPPRFIDFETDMDYRFFYSFRAWFSPYFRYLDGGFFKWIE